MSSLRFCVLIFSVVLFSLTSAVFALPEGYVMETVAQYNSSGLGSVYDLAVDSDGIIYVSQRGDESLNFTNGSITRIDGSNVQTRWVENIGNMRSLVWAGGTAFGENLLFVSMETRKFYTLNTNGTYSPLTDYIYNGPSSFDVDRNGSFGGSLISAPRGTDCIQMVAPDGSVTTLTSWPGVINGGALDVAVSPTSRYGGNAFIAYNDTDTNSSFDDGIYEIDNIGNVTQLISSENAHAVEFDTSGLMFDNDLFAIFTKEGVEGMHLWRIDEQGNAEDFMRVGWGITRHLTFGPDGSMYLSKYFGDTTEIIRISEVPEPASLMLLGLGGFLVSRKYKRG